MASYGVASRSRFHAIMLTCSFRTCDLETVDVLFPYLACVTVQQVFLDGKPVSEPVHSQALDSEPPSGDRLVPARTPAHRRRTAMPLDGKEKVLDAEPHARRSSGGRPARA